jgi:tetratricopeptide (TPR) repeat protein
MRAPPLRARGNAPEQESVRSQIDHVMGLMAEGNAAAASGDYASALDSYSAIVQRYPELALAERARVTRAQLLYQVGRVEEALLQLEDEEVSLRGSAEVHAALAAVLHAERPAQVGRAEQQWAIAAGFDTRFEDVEWVQRERHWPPRLVEALRRFLTLT